jgi:hypothetical protein
MTKLRQRSPNSTAPIWMDAASKSTRPVLVKIVPVPVAVVAAAVDTVAAAVVAADTVAVAAVAVDTAAAAVVAVDTATAAATVAATKPNTHSKLQKGAFGRPFFWPG